MTGEGSIFLTGGVHENCEIIDGDGLKLNDVDSVCCFLISKQGDLYLKKEVYTQAHP